MLDSVLNNNYLNQVKNDLLSVISNGRKNACFTTTISIGTISDPNEFTKTYNNNTPFDVSMILLKLEDDVQLIISILKEYINNQMSEGSWYLNFSEVYKIKTWTTAEALICLEQAFEKYDIIVTDAIEKYWKQKVFSIDTQLKKAENEKSCLEKENRELCDIIEKDKIRNKLFTILIFIAIVAGLILGIKWIIDPANSEKPIYAFWANFILPIALGILSGLISNWFFNIYHKYKKQ